MKGERQETWADNTGGQNWRNNRSRASTTDDYSKRNAGYGTEDIPDNPAGKDWLKEEYKRVQAKERESDQGELGVIRETETAEHND